MGTTDWLPKWEESSGAYVGYLVAGFPPVLVPLLPHQIIQGVFVTVLIRGFSLQYCPPVLPTLAEAHLYANGINRKAR